MKMPRIFKPCESYRPVLFNLSAQRASDDTGIGLVSLRLTLFTQKLFLSFPVDYFSIIINLFWIFNLKTHERQIMVDIPLPDENTINFMENISRPVIFRSSCSEYPWYGLGTAFIVGYKKNLFVITAKHVVENNITKNEVHNAVELQRFNVFLPGFNDPLPLDGCAVYEPGKDNPDLTHVGDVIIYHVNREHFQELFPGYKYLSLQAEKNFLSPSTLKPGEYLAVFGYPEEGRSICFDRKELIAKPYLKGGILVEKLLDYLYVFQSKACDYDFNGLSGSPVFHLSPAGIRIVGMALRGSNSSGKLNFLDVELILHGIERIYQENSGFS